MGKNKVVAEMAKKVIKRLREEVGKKGLKLPVNENGKEGKSKMIASCAFLVEELRQWSKEEEVTMADSVETLGVDLRTRVKIFGAERKSEKKKCRMRFSLIKTNKAAGVKKLLRAGMVPARSWRVHAVGIAPAERLKLRRQDGSCGGQKKSTTSLSLSMEAFGVEVEGELSTMATQTYAGGVWTGTWYTEQTEACLNQVLEVEM